MSTMNIAPLLAKGLEDNTGMEYKRYPKLYPKFYHIDTTGGRIVDIQGWIPLSIPVERTPGEPTGGDQIRPDFNKRFIVSGYGKELSLAQEDADDDVYGLLVRWVSARGGQVAMAYVTLEETVAANYLAVTAYTTTSPAPEAWDGQPFASTAHPMSAFDTATTWSNLASTPIALSMAGLQSARANIESQYMANGETFINNKLARIIVNPMIAETAYQLQKSGVTSADNQVNTLKGEFEVVVDPYFRRTFSASAAGSFDSWVAQGEMHNLLWWNREEIKYDNDKDVHTRSMIFTSHRRFTFGHTDPRGHYFAG